MFLGSQTVSQERADPMTDGNVILVGVDGSPESLAAVDWAVARAERQGWRVHILCAYSLPSFTTASLDGGYAALDDSAIRSGAQAVIDEAVERVKKTGVAVTSSLETGDPAGVLVDSPRRPPWPSSVPVEAVASQIASWELSPPPCPRTVTARPSSCPSAPRGPTTRPCAASSSGSTDPPLPARLSSGPSPRRRRGAPSSPPSPPSRWPPEPERSPGCRPPSTVSRS